MLNKIRISLAPGVGLNIISDDRFKSEFFSISFITPLKSGENTVSYILPSLLLRGSQKYPKARDIGRALQECYDTELSGESYRMGNAKIIRFGMAFISEDYTDFPIRQRVFDLLNQIILHPLKEESSELCHAFTELEKNSVIDLIKTKINNKKSYAFSRCRDILLDGDDCGVSKHGTIKSAMELSPKAVTEFYNRMISDFSIEFFYEGPAGVEYIKSLIESTFGELIREKKTSPEALGGFIPAPTVPETCKTESSECEQTILCMGFETPHIDANDFSARLFTEILSSSSVSRLFMNIREKRGLCYFCDYNTIAKKDRAIICAGLKYSKLSEAKQAILDEIHDISLGNISDYEFYAAKASLKNAYLGVNDSPHSIESWEIASLFLKEYLTPEDVIAKIEALEKSDVSRYAAQLKLKVVYVLKEESDE